jgi:hypothetical protein
MIQFREMICPVSPERMDENRVRATAMGVVLIMGAFLFTGELLFGAFLAMDFGIRAFTKLKYSPLSWLAHHFVNAIGTRAVPIPKAPKVFAARIGFLLTSLSTLFALLGMPYLSLILGTTLVGFAFMECGLNFCAGCWVYTYVVYPLVRKDQ